MASDRYGNLSVRALTGGGALPVEGAVVRISGAGENNSDIEYSLITDLDGITERIDLPAPSIEFSLNPGQSEQAYSLYNVEISSEGYYTKRIFDVPLFEGISAVQLVDMVPKGKIHGEGVTYPRGNLNVIVLENENLE